MSNSTHSFWIEHSYHQRSLCALVASALSLFGSLGTVGYMILNRYHPRVRTAINECILAFFVLSVFGSLNMLISSSIRLLHPTAMQSFCDASGLAVQLFTISAEICEAGYFATILNELQNKGRNDFSFPRRIIGAATVFGVVSSIIAISVLPVNPVWGTRLSPEGEPWCWLPDGAAKFVVMKVFLAYGVLLITFIVSCYSMFHLISVLRIVSRDSSTPIKIPISVKLRLVYFVVFALVWIVSGFHRFTPDPTDTLGIAQAVLEPLLPFMNAIVFSFADGPLRRCRGMRWQTASSAESKAIVVSGSDSGDLPQLYVNRDSHGSGRSFENQVNLLVAAAEDDDAVLHAGLNDVVSWVHQAAAGPRRITAKIEICPETSQLIVVEIEDASTTDHEQVAAGAETDSATSTVRPPRRSHAQQELSVTSATSSSSRLGDPVETKVEPPPREPSAPSLFEQRRRQLELANAGALHFRIPQLERPYLTVVFSYLAGYCDCCGFITLDLFTAHVTGNFATISMSVVRQSSDLGLKIAGLVVFCVFVSLSQLTITQVEKRRLGSPARILLVTQTTLLLASCVFSTVFGPFVSGSHVPSVPGAYLTGMFMVAAMAVQNVFQRVYLIGLPMTTLMTGNTTGFFIDVFSWTQLAARNRMKNASLVVVAFCTGCATVTAMVVYVPDVAYVVPPLVAIVALTLGWNQLEAPTIKAS